MKIDYKKMKELSDAVHDHQQAIERIMELAEKLVSTGNSMDVEIILTESMPHKPKDLFDKQNVGPVMELDEVFQQVFRMQAPNQKPKEVDRRIGLKQDKMPNEVALIMLDSINKWYNIRLKQCQFELHQMIMSINDTHTKAINNTYALNSES